MTNKNYSLNEFEKKVEELVDEYFNNYTEYNEITINDYFTNLFYTTNLYEEIEIENEAEQIVREIVFKRGVKHASQHKD